MDTLSRDFDLLRRLSVVSFIFEVRLRRGFVLGDGDSGLKTLLSVRALKSRTRGGQNMQCLFFSSR